MADRTISMLAAGRLEEALDLVWKTFMEYEGPGYPAEGIAEFRDYIQLENIREMMDEKRFVMWACQEGEKILGILAMRLPAHISLLFVDKRFHRQGIARSLIAHAGQWLREQGVTGMEVHSSPYAVRAYRRMGFVEEGPEVLERGIRFVPMVYKGAE